MIAPLGASCSGIRGVQHPAQSAAPRLALARPAALVHCSALQLAPSVVHQRQRPRAVQARDAAKVLSGNAGANGTGSSSSSSVSVSSAGSLGSIDYDTLMGQSPTCPLGGVYEVILANARTLLLCTPDETLEAILPRLSKVSGLPVIDPTSKKVVGVISRKDIIRVRRVNGSLSALVGQHMTAPAITISIRATVQEGADLMLKHKIRRLPVVDDAGLPVGILARTDIFKPLFEEQYVEVMEREKAAMLGQSAKKKKKKPITWDVKYLYDGDCAMCLSLKAILERRDHGKGKIKFVNIASPDYNPSRNMGVLYDDAMETIHAIRPDGQVVYGTDALRALFGAVGLGWVASLTAVPFFSQLVDALYHFLSSNRISLGGVMDALIAVKRVEMSKQGVETCQDMDEECTVEW